MKHIVLSDIHESFHNLHLALSYAKQNNITSGFVLGDLINPGIMHKCGKSGLKLSVVLGNNDGDIFELSKAAQKYSNITLFKDFGVAIVDGIQIFMIHDNRLGALVAKSNEYPLVMCGHNHICSKEILGKAILLNPGELSGHMYGESTFVIWDSMSNTCQKITIKSNWVDVKRYEHDQNFHFSLEMFLNQAL